MFQPTQICFNLLLPAPICFNLLTASQTCSHLWPVPTYSYLLQPATWSSNMLIMNRPYMAVVKMLLGCCNCASCWCRVCMWLKVLYFSLLLPKHRILSFLLLSSVIELTSLLFFMLWLSKIIWLDFDGESFNYAG